MAQNETIEPKDFATRLKQLRRMKNMTQSELAAKIPVSRSCIANYETSIRKPNEDILSLLSSSLDVSVDYFADRQNHSENEMRKQQKSELQTEHMRFHAGL